ncbi:MAG: hypothetical protein R3B74_15245 [Nitrospirales bacterium]|nr:hypothetical protein [Nitrospirales bacterium]
MISLTFAGIGGLVEIRDAFSLHDWALFNWVPPIPWYYWIIVSLVLIIAFLFEGGFKAYRKLQDQQEPKLKIEYNERDPSLFFPETIIPTSGGGETIERRALVRIHNSSTCQAIKNVEIYCESIRVLRDGESSFKITFPVSRRPIIINPTDYFTSGMVRQLIQDFNGRYETERRFEVQIVPKRAFGHLSGLEFEMKVLVNGEIGQPALETFQFGEKDGVFYCKRLA